MKKNGKFIVGLLSAAAVAGGAYYFVKKFLNKDSKDDFDDFEDDFEDFDFDDDADVPSDGREYVTLNMTSSAEETIPSEAEDVSTCESKEALTDAFIITEEEMEDVEDVFEEESSEEPADTLTNTDETDIIEE